MPTSAPGSEGPSGSRRARGFTLIELMVVVALIAVAAGVVSLSLRDSAAQRLEQEAVRLAALFETARAEARASGLPVRWMLTPESSEHAFRFVGLPASRRLPGHWAHEGVVARVQDLRGVVVLGPEALIGAQRVTLELEGRRVEVATDGLRPFAASTERPGSGS